MSSIHRPTGESPDESKERTDKDDLGKTLYVKLNAFGARYMKNPHPLKQYNSRDTKNLFQQKFMTLKTFQKRFAPGYAEEQIKIFNAERAREMHRGLPTDTWPRGHRYFYHSHTQDTGPTLSEQICEYVIKIIYPRPKTLKSSHASTDLSWYDLFNKYFPSFSFVASRHNISYIHDRAYWQTYSGEVMELFI